MPTPLRKLRNQAAAKYAAKDESLAAGEPRKQAKAKGRIAKRGEKDREKQLEMQGLESTSLTGFQEKTKKLPSGRKAAKAAGVPSLRESRKGVRKTKKAQGE